MKKFLLLMLVAGLLGYFGSELDTASLLYGVVATSILWLLALET